MTTLITTKEEIKAYLGISGTSKDAMINLWNKTATEILAGMLKVQDLAVHTVTNELVRVYNPEYLMLREFIVSTSGSITIKDALLNEITGFTFDLDSNAKRRLFLKDTSGNPKSLYYPEIYATYTAGYTLQDTLEIVDNGALDTKTFTVSVAGVETTYTLVSGVPSTNEIQIGASAALTAAAIAAVFTGASSSSATVTMQKGATITLGTLTSAEATLTSATMPEALKVAVALIVGGAMTDATQKRGGVTSYTLGSKSVSFADTSSKNMFESIINEYLGEYKTTNMRAV